ncbi:MAG: phosphotransferase family protein [Dehalococcoidia bacterium]|nr:phosphotransferase family protein [Dehalococcoidia bacterium]
MQPVEGGASNLTYRVDLEGAPLGGVALRMQRREGIFQPYNVVREAELLRRLQSSPIPVPQVLHAEWDPEVLGARFIVLEWIDAPHMGEAGPEASFDAFTRMVAAIHALDWDALGLRFLGVPTDPGNAILSELGPFAKRMKAFECQDDPLLRRALGALQRQRPVEGQLALCQGDINVFNYLFRGGEVVGVVDWEEGRIGDPRSDVGHLIALAHLKGAPFGDVRDMPFLQAYEAASGRRLENMEYFRALWFFKLAVIYYGWVRFSGGSTPWYSWDEVSSLLEQSLAEITP